MEITRIWFDGDYIYGVADDGNTYRQSLLWYPGLRAATPEERADYEDWGDGYHWPKFNEDVSFESFAYDDADPTPLQRFFLTHREISPTGFARRFGLDPQSLHQYIHGFKKPTEAVLGKINAAIKQLAAELSAAAF